jgi:NagD protein
MEFENLKNITCFVFDMDGTIYKGETLFKGVSELFNLFDKEGIKYYFLTNNSSKTSKIYLKKLNRLGLQKINEHQIITSGDVTIDYLHKNNINRIFVIGTPEFENQCMKSGLKLIQNKNEQIDAVVVGFDTTFHYKKGEIATHYLRKGVPFISTNEDLACPMENEEFIPDCGAITSLLELASGKKTKYLGKPRKETTDYLLNHIQINKNELAIVGDRLYTDIATGFLNGFTSIAVLTGEFKLSDLQNSSIVPTLIIDDVSVLFNAMQNNISFPNPDNI